jgi:peptidoglycan-N-acetylglucosamine deacetylase
MRTHRPTRLAAGTALAVVVAALLPAPVGAQTVALTFDDGPSAYTGDVIRILRERNVPATFFLVGSNIAGREGLLRRMDRRGHEIGSHSWDHPDLRSLSAEGIASQLDRTSEEIERVVGHGPAVFRPPYGAVNDTVRAVAAEQGLATVLWNVDPVDWSRPGCRTIIERATSSSAQHLNILFHDGGGPREQTVCAVPRVIRRLSVRGYQFVTVSQQLDISATGPAWVPVIRDHSAGADFGVQRLR